MRSIAMVCVLLALTSVSKGAVLVEGQDQTFTGPGVYTFDFTVTAVGQTETILGFTFPLLPANGATVLPEVPDTTLSDIAFTPNPLLENVGASSDFGTFGFSISSLDSNGSPLTLNDGESAILFSIPMNVLVAGDVIQQNAALSSLLAITGASEVQFGPNFAAVAQPVPSPTGLLALCSLGMVGAGMQFRRRRRS